MCNSVQTAFLGIARITMFGGGSGGFGQSQPGTSTFGQSQGKPNTGFGQPTNTSTGFGGAAQTTSFGQPSGFGGASGSTTGFGQPQQQSQTPSFGQPAGSTFGGSKPATPGFGQPASSSFGQPAASTFGQPASSSFGQPATSTFGQPASSAFGQPAGSGFGGSKPATPGFGQPASTSTFGQSSTFGQPSTSGPTSTFGQPATQTGTAFGGQSSFGAPASSSFGGFGQSKPTGFGQSSSGFGAPAPNAAFGGAFGGQSGSQFGGSSLGTMSGMTTAGGFGHSTPALPNAASNMDPSHWWNRVSELSESYNAESPNCKFLTSLYDLPALQLPPTPVPGAHQAVLQHVQMANPDPSKYTPVLLVGVEALKARLILQEQLGTALQARIEAITSRTGELQAKLSNVERNEVPSLEISFSELSHRLLEVSKKIDSIRGSHLYLSAEETRVLRVVSESTREAEKTHNKVTLLKQTVAQAEHAPPVQYERLDDPQYVAQLRKAISCQRRLLKQLQERTEAGLMDSKIILNGYHQLRVTRPH